MRIGERIKAIRESRGFSQGELGEAVGKGQTTVSSWERDRTMPSREDVQRIADTLRVPVSDIEGIEGSRPFQAAFVEIPVISWVSAGKLIEAGESLTGQESDGPPLLISDLPKGDYFATEVKGDSMDRISPEGSRIIVNCNDKELREGRCYLFCHRGETTYKRFRGDPVKRLEPYSTNPANVTIFPKADKDWIVVGRVVRSYIDLD